MVLIFEIIEKVNRLIKISMELLTLNINMNQNYNLYKNSPIFILIKKFQL